MTNERISIEVVKPKYKIGQQVYVPQKDSPTQARIIRYNFEVGKVEEKLLGRLRNYELDKGVILRLGDDFELTFSVHESNICADRQKAEEYSKFLSVDVDDEMWKRAIGNRDMKDENSPYGIDNSGLPSCCADISEARDVLLYCQKQKGLIVHDRDLLKELLDGHGHPTTFQKGSPIEIILEKLEIGRASCRER